MYSVKIQEYRASGGDNKPKYIKCDSMDEALRRYRDELANRVTRRIAEGDGAINEFKIGTYSGWLSYNNKSVHVWAIGPGLCMGDMDPVTEEDIA